VAVGNSGTEPDFDAGGRLRLRDRLSLPANDAHLPPAMAGASTPAALGPVARAGRASVYAVHVSVDLILQH
jgi:hypothetical protein